MSKVIKTAVFLTAMVMAGCSTESQSESEPQPIETVVQTETTAIESTQELLFFMNPMGRPCQMQDDVLSQMGEDLTENASVTYIKTTESSARQKFMQYGVRALPTMILLNSDGSVAHRFTPGIQSVETIQSALN